MKKQIVLHLGLHKTGTTFLQRVIFPGFRDWAVLTRPYTHQNKAFSCLQFADESLYRPEEILEEINQIPSEKIIISDESLSGKVSGFNHVNRSIIFRRLAEAFPDAKVIITLRGQKEILVSHYRNHIQTFPNTYMRAKDLFWIRNGEYFYTDNSDKPFTKPIHETLYYNNNYDNFHLEGFHHYQPIKLLTELFYKPNVNVLLYEDLRSNPSGYIDRLEQIIGQPLDNRDQLNLNKKVREGSSNKDLAAKRIENWVREKMGNRKETRLKLRVGKLTRIIARPFVSADIIRSDIDYIKEITDGYYDKTNAKLHAEFPEVGLDRHPQAYPMDEVVLRSAFNYKEQH